MRIELPTAALEARIEDGIGWLVFSRPERHNALSVDMQSAIPQAINAFAADSQVRVVVLRGSGERAFISGADVSEFETERSTRDARSRYGQTFARAAASLAELDKPVIAMIHGYCLGGGLAVALTADLRLASRDAQFAIPAARLGLGYRFSGVKVLVDLVGPGWASAILLTGHRFSAEEAFQMGLIHRVTAKTELETEVRELAATLASNAPLTLRAAKVAIREACKDPADRDLKRCTELVDACFESEDYREGRSAFLDKRTPQFRGR